MYIHVRVHANAKKESWTLKKPAYFEASVREKAENNQANARVLHLVANHFGVVVDRVRIVNGHHSPSKLIVVQE
jgi:uncharacterized protein YggU (UPF0235/DUF167 family)